MAEANRCPELDEIKPSTKKEEEEEKEIERGSRIPVVVAWRSAAEGRKEGRLSLVLTVVTFGFKGTGPYVSPLRVCFPSSVMVVDDETGPSEFTKPTAIIKKPYRRLP